MVDRVTSWQGAVAELPQLALGSLSEPLLKGRGSECHVGELRFPEIAGATSLRCGQPERKPRMNPAAVECGNTLNWLKA